MEKKYHFIGIGGIGMSGIAQLLLRSGAGVSGSDVKESRATQELRGLGADIFIGHAASNIDGAGVVVYSSAIKEDNPEIKEARRRGIQLIKRAQALAELMKDKSVITVAGSHGKTTTTSLVSYMLLEAGFSPTIAIGGILRNINTNACLGNGEYFVAEADESDGSFLYYRPKYSVITNIDKEHLDYYRDFSSELKAFGDFIARTEKDGCVFYCDDDPNLKAMLKGSKIRCVSFGMTERADIYPKDISLDGLSSSFECFKGGKSLGRFHLALGGRHNVSNSLAVIGLGTELQINPEVIGKTLSLYKGAKRRLEIKFSDPRITVIDDYAHHPTEIKATLEAARALKSGRLVAVFQPHRFTRTQILMDEFAGSFDLADSIILTDIYAASELPIPGIDSGALREKLKERYPAKEIVYLPKEQIADYALKNARPRDLLITIGAGDIVKISDELAQRLSGENKG